VGGSGGGGSASGGGGCGGSCGIVHNKHDLFLRSTAALSDEPEVSVALRLECLSQLGRVTACDLRHHLGDNEAEEAEASEVESRVMRVCGQCAPSSRAE
jgi:hypothetical protein